MTIEEELLAVREEKKVLREQLAPRDELIQQQALLAQQNAVNQQHAEQMNCLSEQMKTLRDRPAKDSRNSHLPSSSDRFVRQPKSLRAIGAKGQESGVDLCQPAAQKR